MEKRAAIVVVDDEADALAAMLEALTRRFGADYCVFAYPSGSTALKGIREILNERREIALVIADQWMPKMTGSKFLGRVRSIEPSGKRALLVAWGDRRASPTILQGCALGELRQFFIQTMEARWRSTYIHW